MGTWGDQGGPGEPPRSEPGGTRGDQVSLLEIQIQDADLDLDLDPDLGLQLDLDMDTRPTAPPPHHTKPTVQRLNSTSTASSTHPTAPPHHQTQRSHPI